MAACSGESGRAMKESELFQPSFNLIYFEDGEQHLFID